MTTFGDRLAEEQQKQQDQFQQIVDGFKKSVNDAATVEFNRILAELTAAVDVLDQPFPSEFEITLPAQNGSGGYFSPDNSKSYALDAWRIFLETLRAQSSSARVLPAPIPTGQQHTWKIKVFPIPQ